MHEDFWKKLQDGTRDRFAGFQDLMPFRVQEILLVASMYDSYTLEEGGHLTELLLKEYRELNLSFAPHVTHATSGEEALNLLVKRRFDMVLTMSRLGDMETLALARRIKEGDPHLAVFGLAFNPRELARLSERDQDGAIDRFFLWSGDVRLLLAIIKSHEDRQNIHHDTRLADVRAILLIEDSVRFYSSYLPLLYTEVLRQTDSLMQDGLNFSHRLLRMRARPKILLARSYEEAWDFFQKHQESLLGVISDARFPWDGGKKAEAGIEFVKRIKEMDPHLPAVIQSSDREMEEAAHAIGAGFIYKNSRRLLERLRGFMLDNFGFGDFVFRLPDGREVGRAGNLRQLVDALAAVPDESLRHHAQHDHFSNWLRARTEFVLAARIRPRKVSEFETTEDLRRYLIDTISRFREEAQRGIVMDFSPQQFDTKTGFVRIGSGSLGGKARGLAFMNTVLNRYGITNHLPDVEIRVPPTAVVATDVFDGFMQQGDLRSRVLADISDEEVVRLVLGRKLPSDIYADLQTFLQQVSYPLAVRSSSLLEDSQYQPFAGVYATYMLPNNHPDLRVRLDQLCDAVKLVYASTYFRSTKAYLEATSNRVEEEKMAVIIQQVVGRQHEHYDYPDFAGVAHSTNFYPTGDLRPEDGVVNLALGLGRTVVEGMKCLRFSPRQPGNLPQFATIKDMLDNSQREFFAVDTSDPDAYPRLQEDFSLAILDLEDAERHGTLEAVGSVYSPENDVVYDGLWREGPRLVTFANILKADLFPLTEVLNLLLELGRRCMSCAVEIEFAGILGDGRREPHQLGFLQIRPLAGGFESMEIDPRLLESPDAFCATDVALGNGRFEGIRDIVVVPPDLFDRGRTVAIASDLARMNVRLREAGRPYLLIGPGRWGSADRWLGIPVRWADISGARVIVETDLADFKVTPSQGTHFFQNLTSFQVGYLTVNQAEGRARLDWDWLGSLPVAEETRHLRHLTLEEPLTVLIDGRRGRAAILKAHAAEA
jgi:CheY-like chemotaxis protein